MVMNDPAVAPAAAKHAQEYMLGNLALSLVRDNTSTPKFFLIQAPYSFFDRTYIEKEIVRTSVTLAMGATTPFERENISFLAASLAATLERVEHVHTTKEASEVLSLVGVSYTINDTVILVCLHASLDAVEGECGESGDNTGAAGSYLCPVVSRPLLCNPL